MTDQSLVLADGRRLGFATFGDSDGRPAIYAHGFPACRLEAELLGPDFSAAEMKAWSTQPWSAM